MATEKQLAYWSKLKGKKLSKEHRKNLSRSRTLEGYIERLGELEGTKQYLEKNANLSVGKESLKKRGYTDKQIKNIKDKHRKKSMVTKESFINKYGKTLGIKKYNDIQIKKKKNNHRRYEYWLSFFNGDKNLAKEALRNVQSRDRNFFISRYGDIDGEIKYREHVKKKTKSFQNRTFNNSKTEIEIGEFIKSKIEDKVIMHPNRYYIYLDDSDQRLLNQKFIIPDITIPDKKIIIEYFGDYWHCSEKMFNDDTYVHPFIKKSVADIRKNDEIKKKILEKLGWKVIIIWESEYNNNKREEVLNEIRRRKQTT